MANKAINELLKYQDRIVDFSDTFTRSNTYVSARHPESSDGNNWLVYTNSVYAYAGISSNKLYFGFDANAATLTSNYRRNLEQYSSFKKSIINFDYICSAKGDGSGISIAIGANTINTNTFITSFFDGIMLKLNTYNNTISLDNTILKSSGSFTFVQGSEYSIEIECTNTFIGAKIWLKSGSKPSLYTIQYSGSLVTSGQYLLFNAVNASSGSGSQHIIDNLITRLIK